VKTEPATCGGAFQRATTRPALPPGDDLPSDFRRRTSVKRCSNVRCVIPSWTLARRFGLDALIVAAAVGGALQVAYSPDALRTRGTSLWFGCASVAMVVLPLLARRQIPFLAPASVWLLGTALSFVDGRLLLVTGVFVAGMAASFLLGTVADLVQARAGLAVVIAGASIVVYHDPDPTAGEFLFTPAQFAIAWLAGFAVRDRAAQAEQAEQRADQAERERESAARVAVAEERARIARELHDIVAHAVSVMVLQTGAVRHQLPDRLGQHKEALKSVEQTGRTALTEMRRLLGAMRHTGDQFDLTPQPGLGSLQALLAEFDRAGLPVRLHLDGDPCPLPPAIDLSAYRIVQEGLTNTLKHANANSAEVVLRYRSDELRIEVRDDGHGAPAPSSAGHGLVGVRERVNIYGGQMSAGPMTGGGFLLSTRLPLDGYPR